MSSNPRPPRSNSETPDNSGWRELTSKKQGCSVWVATQSYPGIPNFADSLHSPKLIEVIDPFSDWWFTVSISATSLPSPLISLRATTVWRAIINNREVLGDSEHLQQPNI
ncbi:hypothetical protein PGT21_016413 [Puccinia graminis f. sp. tritici]|uniref:Uncharacterized protein n=1 Tax=Puccinia graminis f. sp. tritici TaxID=56615 RepID=A0A5B0PMZ0_PUCGR|nr:hypothetical protein PGT21_016413 [Puccinia graminis f. sp. tritici]